MEDNQEKEVAESEEIINLSAEQNSEGKVEFTPMDLDAHKHFYCLQVKCKLGSKEDEVIINRIAVMAGKSMTEQTQCNHGVDNMVIENTFSIATAIAGKNEDFFAKALYCKYEKYPIGIMLGTYNPVLRIAISPVLYIEPKYKNEELVNKLCDTFKYWAINTKKADKALLEKLVII